VRPRQPAMFFPIMRGVDTHLPTRAMILVRSDQAEEQIAAALRHTLGNVEANVPFSVSSWDDEVARSLVPARAATTVLTILGLLAAMLAVTGIFGMASYAVSKRMKEQGIRIALGARYIQVMRSTLGRPVMLLLTGSTIGLVMGVLTNHLIAYIVAYANAREPLILTSALLMMILLGLLATFIPARRMLAIDPAQLLQAQ
jgi:ABC-type antimicrobial peptide transport system permease subunit